MQLYYTWEKGILELLREKFQTLGVKAMSMENLFVFQSIKSDVIYLYFNHHLLIIPCCIIKKLEKF